MLYVNDMKSATILTFELVLYLGKIRITTSWNQVTSHYLPHDQWSFLSLDCHDHPPTTPQQPLATQFPHILYCNGDYLGDFKHPNCAIDHRSYLQRLYGKMKFEEGTGMTFELWAVKFGAVGWVLQFVRRWVATHGVLTMLHN